MARFFVKASSIARGKATVKGAEYHHMRNVLRLRPGDRVVIFDGTGNEHEGEVGAMAATHATIDLSRTHRPARESPLAITLAQALPKGSRMDLVVEKTTELGVTAIIPFTSSHTAAREPRAVGPARVERWRRIAAGAAKQCGRAIIPAIQGPVSWEDVMASAQAFPVRLILDPAAPVGPGRQILAVPIELRKVMVAVGPEGGFSTAEREQARQVGFQAVNLGPRILRSETAGIVAAATCQLWWGDLR